MKDRQHYNCFNKKLLALLFYSIVVIIANHKLLFLDSVMKWDIIDFHLPMATYISDTIRQGTLPLWNPMINYGYPSYSQIGNPLWYPTTLFLGLMGYSVRMMHIEYLIHVILAGFFMFLFAYDYLEQKEFCNSSYAISIIAGLVYCFSGMFFSNSEHIMLIVSCTLIPICFLTARRYILTGNNKYLLYGGFACGLNILGGYPGFFFIFFVLILLYIIYEYYKQEKGLASIIIDSVATYLKLAFFSIVSCAISLIPFIHSLPYLTRGKMDYGFIQHGSLTLNALITTVVPGISKYRHLVDNADISMINMYTSIIIIITVPFILLKKSKKSKFFLAMALVSFLMVLGSNAFLHPLAYRFIPFFNTFRFPSIWRIYITFFLVMSFVIEINQLLIEDDKESIKTTISVIRYCLGGVILTIFLLYLQFLMLNSAADIGVVKDIIPKIGMVAFILAGYMLAFKKFSDFKKEQWYKNTLYFLVVIVLIEVLVFHSADFDHVIGDSNPHYVQSLIGDTKNRVKNINFNQNNLVSFFPKISNREIIYQRLFEQEGYNSYKLQNIDAFNHTYYRLRAQGRPVVYFTTEYMYLPENKVIENLSILDQQKDIVTTSDKNRSTIISDNYSNLTNYSILKEHEISENIFFENKQINIAMPLDLNYSNIPLIDITFNAQDHDNAGIKLRYIDTTGFFRELSVVTSIQAGHNNKKIFIPTNISNLENVVIEFDDKSIQLHDIKCRLYEMAREQREKNIIINSFKPNEIDINIKVNKDGYLVFQQAMYPGWKAYSNGVEVPLEFVNYIFRGIKLSEGQYDIKLKFFPLDFYVGAMLSIVYWIAFMVISMKDIYAKWRNRGFNLSINVRKKD